MFALPERIKTYDRNTREIIERYHPAFRLPIRRARSDTNWTSEYFFLFCMPSSPLNPCATIRTLREVLEEEPKTPEQSKFWPYVQTLDEDAKPSSTSNSTSKATTPKLNAGFVQRLYGILRVPAFNRMFTATANRLDLFRELNAGRTILVNTSKSSLETTPPLSLARYIIAQTLSSCFSALLSPPLPQVHSSISMKQRSIIHG